MLRASLTVLSFCWSKKSNSLLPIVAGPLSHSFWWMAQETIEPVTGISFGKENSCTSDMSIRNDVNIIGSKITRQPDLFRTQMWVVSLPLSRIALGVSWKLDKLAFTWEFILVLKCYLGPQTSVCCVFWVKNAKVRFWRIGTGGGRKSCEECKVIAGVQTSQVCPWLVTFSGLGNLKRKKNSNVDMLTIMNRCEYCIPTADWRDAIWF